MRKLSIAILLGSLCACTQALGTVPSQSQLRSAIDQQKGWETLSTVNCEGNVDCYGSTFGELKIRSVECAEKALGRAVCNYEFQEDSTDEWERAQSELRIGIGPDGKQQWLVEPTEEI